MQLSFRCSLALLLATSSLICFGCGDPTLYPITGKVTLGGKPHERLIAYFDPINRKVNEFNLGVGETDADGNLTLRSSAGNGLAVGSYRVSFTYEIRESGKSRGLSDEKDDSEFASPPKEMVPEPYCDRRNSPVEFQINRSANEFNFDIPPK